jgi:hypothetical protein
MMDFHRVVNGVLMVRASMRPWPRPAVAGIAAVSMMTGLMAAKTAVRI